MWTDSPVNSFFPQTESLFTGYRVIRQIRGDSKSRDLRITLLRPKVVGGRKNNYEIMHLFRDKIGRASSWLFGLFRLFHEMRPEYFVICWDHFEFSIQFTWAINRGYYMTMQKHEISLRVLKNISRVSAPFELFYEFKVTKCCPMMFFLCWVLRSKIAFMRCVTFSNVLYVFGLPWIIN